MNTKTRPIYIMPAGDTLQIWRYTKTESEGMEEVLYANGNKKKAGVAILMSDKTDIKTRF